MRRSFCLLLACLLGTGVGCESSQIRALDRELERMIRDQRSATLADELAADPDIVPQASRYAGPPGSPYDTRPPTRNPTAAELPAKAQSADARADQMPQMLGSMENATVLDLEKSLAYAIEHSRQYRFGKEELYLTAIDLLAERHLWGPRFFDVLTTTLAGTPEAGDYDHAVELVNQLGVTQRLPYGGSVSASALVNYVEAVRRASDSDIETGQAAAVNLGVIVPLVRGAGIVAQEDLIQAERSLIYAARSFERFRREFLVDVATRYFNLLAFQAQITNLEEQVRNFEWLSQRTAAFAEAGREPYFEVQRAEQQVLFARNNLLNAQENYASALDSFKLVLGMPTTQEASIQPVELAIPEPELDAEAAVQTAWTYRLDLQTRANLVDDAVRGLKVAENQMLPDLDTFGDVTVPTDPGKQNAGQDLDAGEGEYRAGVRLSAPLDRRLEELDRRKAMITLDRARRSYTQLRDQVALEVRSSVRRIHQAQFTLELQERNVTLSERRLQGVVLRLDVLGPRDFIEAQEDLLEASNRRDAAVRDLRVSVLQFLLNSGQMRVAPDGRWMPPARLSPVEIAAEPAAEGQANGADAIVNEDEMPVGDTPEPSP